MQVNWIAAALQLHCSCIFGRPLGNSKSCKLPAKMQLQSSCNAAASHLGLDFKGVFAKKHGFYAKMQVNWIAAALQLHCSCIAAAFLEDPLETQKVAFPAKMQLQCSCNAAASHLGLDFKGVFAQKHGFYAKMQVNWIAAALQLHF